MSFETRPIPMESWKVGDLVEVESRTGIGENRPGGIGRITRVEGKISVDVKYVLGGSEREIRLEFIKAYTLEDNRKRTIQGRCRRCGSLIIDCGHRQPRTSSLQDECKEEEDFSEQREIAARRRRLARSWRRAIVIESESEDDDSDDGQEEGSVVADEDDDDDAWLDQSIVANREQRPPALDTTENDDACLDTPIVHSRENRQNSMPAAEEKKEDDEFDAWLDRPIVELRRKRMKHIQAQPLSDDEITDDQISTAVRLKSVPFLAPEDDGESLPIELAALVPKGSAKPSELSRVMRRLQRVCETKGLPQARREVSALRLRAASLKHDIEADIDSFDDACEEVRALIIGGLRRRCLDVADACYRRLSRKKLPQKACIALESAALKQDQLDDAIRQMEQELKAIRGMGHAARGSAQNESDQSDLDQAPSVTLPKKRERAPRDSVKSKKKKRRDHDSCLHNVWGWALPAKRKEKETHRRELPPETEALRERTTNPNVIPRQSNNLMKSSSSSTAARPRAEPTKQKKKQKKRKKHPVWQVETQSTNLTVPKCRNDLIQDGYTIHYPCPRFALGSLRRVADNLAATVEGASTETSVAAQAIQVVLGAPQLALSWSCAATILACLDDARKAARYHDRAALASIEVLELALLARCCDSNHPNDTKDAVQLLLQRLCSDHEHSTLVSLAQGKMGARLRAWAWRLVATFTNTDLLSQALASVSLKTAQLAATAFFAEPSVQTGLDQLWPALRPKWLHASFDSRLELVSAIKAATAICVAGAGTDEELLWHLWQKAISQAEDNEDGSSLKVSDVALNRAMGQLPRHRLALTTNSNMSMIEDSSLAACVASLFLSFLSRRSGLKRRRLAMELLRRRARPAVVANRNALPVAASTLLSLLRTGLLDADAAFVRGLAACFEVAENAHNDEAIALAFLSALSTSTGTAHAIAFDVSAKRELFGWLLTSSRTSMPVAGNAMSLLLEHDEFPVKQRAAAIRFAAHCARQNQIQVAARLAAVALQPELTTLSSTSQQLDALRHAALGFDQEWTAAILETIPALAKDHRFEPSVVTALSRLGLLLPLLPTDAATSFDLQELTATVNTAIAAVTRASAQARSLIIEHRQAYPFITL